MVNFSKHSYFKKQRFLTDSLFGGLVLGKPQTGIQPSHYVEVLVPSLMNHSFRASSGIQKQFYNNAPVNPFWHLSV